MNDFPIFDGELEIRARGRAPEPAGEVSLRRHRDRAERRPRQKRAVRAGQHVVAGTRV